MSANKVFGNEIDINLNQDLGRLIEAIRKDIRAHRVAMKDCTIYIEHDKAGWRTKNGIIFDPPRNP